MKKLLFLLIILFPIAGFAQSGQSARPFFEKKTLGEIRITLPAKNWNDALDSMRLYGEGMMLGSLVVDQVRYDSVGVRFRGNNSYQMGMKRNPFQIKLDFVKSGQNHQGYSSIKLSSALRDPSLVREVLFHEIAANYMPSPQASYTKLFVNDEYVGVFINLESVDGQFLRKHYGSEDNPLFKAGVDYKTESDATNCKQNIYGSLEYEENVDCYLNNFEMKSDRGWLELRHMTKVLNQTPDQSEQVLDVDRALWMLALNNVMVNLSSYSGHYSINYYLYQDNHGHFQPIHWDLNLSFGSFKNTGKGSDLDLRDLQRLDPLLHADNPYKPLISKLLQDPLNRKIYLAHIRQINDDYFSNAAYEARAKELQSMIVVPFNDDKNKIYSLEDFQNSLKETIGRKSKIPGIVELMSRRSRFLSSHPELNALPSAISDVAVQGRGKFENEKVNTFRITAKADRYPQKMIIYYRFAADQPYQSMVMAEESPNNLPSGMKNFSVSIDAPSEDAVLDYYLLSENPGTVLFLPRDYTNTPYKVKLSDLNK
ncbi:MAG: CotH kinase family protein [Lewinellaceae bacterium]|nr:CotH kinase family protein [Lewinellaceae bacterium]